MLNLIVTNGPEQANSYRVQDCTRHLVGRIYTPPLKNDKSISRVHAELLCEGSRWFVNDLSSTNGTFINDHPVTAKTEIRMGDQLRFGNTRMLVDIMSNGSGHSAHTPRIGRLIEQPATAEKAKVGQLPAQPTHYAYPPVAPTVQTATNQSRIKRFITNAILSLGWGVFAVKALAVCVLLLQVYN